MYKDNDVKEHDSMDKEWPVVEDEAGKVTKALYLIPQSLDFIL